jgi:chromosome segregation ATPase
MDSEHIAEAELGVLEQKIEKILTLIEKLQKENQNLNEVINRLQTERNAVIDRINLMLDKIDELL